MRKKPKLAILPHPEAPIFSNCNPAEAGLIIDQIASELSSSSSIQTTETVRQVIRQAGFVSLWIFLKFIAGYSGPYDEINDDLQLDMCNFRQSPVCMEPGARWGGFIPRSGNKSTIFTHGGTTWELLRNPDLTFLIINAVEGKAYEFVSHILHTFRDNELMQWLYPEYIITKKSQASVILPNRKKISSIPSVDYKGFSGELAGTHVNHLIFDDIIGVEDLDSQMMASVSMDRGMRKYQTAIRALLVKEKYDRVGHIGTLYALNDLHSIVTKDCKSVTGFQEGFIKPKPTGTWNLYYRKAIENGTSIDEEHYTVESMEKLRIADAWSFYSQYQNDPKEGSSLELYSYPLKTASLTKEPSGRWVITYDYSPLIVTGDYNHDRTRTITKPLSSLYITIGVDFAATSKGVTARTSRSAIEMWGQDGYSNKFLLREIVDYLGPRQVIEALFKLHEDFEGYISQTILESNALQKFFIPLIKEEALKRDIYFPATPKAESQPKEVRIRAGVGAALAGNNVYIVEGQGAAFVEERDVFPQDAVKRDALDAASKAIVALRKPLSDEEEIELEQEEEDNLLRQRSKAGY